MTAAGQTINQRKSIGNKTNTPSDTVCASPRSTRRQFQEITKQIILRSSAATAAHAPRCHVTPILHGGADRGNTVAPTDRWPTHADGNGRFSHHSTSNTYCSVANSRSGAQQGLDHKLIQAALPATHQKGRKTSHVTPNTLNDKSASQMLARTSSEMRRVRVAAPDDKRVAGQYAKGGSQMRDLVGKANKSRNDQLCKNCKTSILESVCFINNDGRITAAHTGGMHDRSLHHCSKLGCAAYRGKDSPKSARSTKSLSRRQVPQPMKIQSESHAEIDDRLSVCSSMSTSSIQKSSHNVRESENVSERNEAQASVQNCSSDDVLDGLSHSEDQPCSPTIQKNRVNQQCYEENGGHNIESRSPATSFISSEIHDHGADDEIGSANRDAVNELHHFKSLCYHGDNEYSCSEDGTGATNTPNSAMTGAFDSPSALDADEEHSEVASQQRRSSVARMRQRYLQSLSEQEAERVRLRKQEMMARKQAEDWMLDCHMEELLHKLAPNGEARVKVLVEAFEQVMHYSDSESSQANHQEHNQMHDDEQDRLNESMHTDSSS